MSTKFYFSFPIKKKNKDGVKATTAKKKKERKNIETLIYTSQKKIKTNKHGARRNLIPGGGNVGLSKRSSMLSEKALREHKKPKLTG